MTMYIPTLLNYLWFNTAKCDNFSQIIISLEFGKNTEHVGLFCWLFCRNYISWYKRIWKSFELSKPFILTQSFEYDAANTTGLYKDRILLSFLPNVWQRRGFTSKSF